MNAIVTGSEGLIGRAIVRMLRAAGHDVFGIDRRNADALGRFDVAHLHGSAWTDRATHAIWHLACNASAKTHARVPTDVIATCTLGTVSACDEALADKAVLVLASTIEVYGAVAGPLVETTRCDLAPHDAQAPYAIGKLAAEAICEAYRRQYGLDTRVARLSNVYGPGMRDDGRLAPSVILAAIRNEPVRITGDGSGLRAFLFVDDAADALVRLGLRDPLPDPLPTNIAGREVASIMEFAEIAVDEVAKSTGRRAEIVREKPRAGDPVARVADISRAKSLLDWEPTTNLRDGIHRTVAWFLAQ